MSKPVYYKVSTYLGKNLGRSKNKSGKTSRKSIQNRRRMQVVASIIGAYALVAGLVSFLVFNITRDPASASESAYISASLKIVEEKSQYDLGDEINAKVTLQNTSLQDSINDLVLDMQSTSGSIKWESLEIAAGRNQGNKIPGSSNSFPLPVLTAGERVEYIASGTLKDNTLDYVTIVGSMRFLNDDGVQEATTNKVFTPLNTINSNQNKLLSLAADKETYSPKQKIEFNLSYRSEENTLIFPEIEGKIFVTDKNSQELVSTLDCELNESGFCINSIRGLDAGNYSAIFMDEEENIFSEIINFEVTGSGSSFSPSSQTGLDFPFGASSQNGIVAVHAKRVMNLNQTPSGQECIFEVIRNGAVVKTFNAKVETERTCFRSIATAELPGEGIYTVRLRGSEQKRDISFLNKSSVNFELANQSSINESGKPVSIKAEGLAAQKAEQEQEPEEAPEEDVEEEAPEPANSQNLKFDLSIWHPRSGEYKVISFINGQEMLVKDGKINLQIPADNFSKGGYYNIFVRTEDGQQSDFLGVSFDSNRVGFSETGVLVEDYNSLRVGKSQIFKVQGITDRSGNLINQGSCVAKIFEVGNVEGELVSGDIENGECKVVVAPGTVRRSGPVLVAFSSPDIESDIYAARQFNFWANNPKDYGSLRFEFEPLIKNTANTLILGPVVDEYNNLANIYDLKLEFYQILEEDQEGLEEGEEPEETEELIRTVDLSVSQGYAEVTIPASIFAADNLKVKLLNSKDKVLLERELQTQELDKSLILPNFPKQIQSTDDIKLGVTGLGLSPEEITNCRLKLYRTENVYEEVIEDYKFDDDGCNFNWKLNEKRNAKKLLLELSVGEHIFSSVLTQKPDEASSLFEFSPQLRLNNSGDLEISFLSSPITDSNRLPIQTGKVRIQYNGKVEEVEIKNGFAKFDITTDKISSSDIRNILEQRFLDISLEARASSTSISKTSDYSIYLGTRDIANNKSRFAIKQARSQMADGSSHIFAFNTESCNPTIISHRGASQNLKSHWQGGACYVEVKAAEGRYTIMFDEVGFDIGEFSFRGNTDSQNIIWCTENPCTNQVLGNFNGVIRGILHDGDKQYKFESGSLDDVITIQQNGLNPLKDYILEIRYDNLQGEPVSFFKEIEGELLVE